MREAQIVCPMYHDGRLDAVRNAKARVVEAFGGYTSDLAYGAWRNPDTGEIIEEHVERLTIACTDGWSNNSRLRSIARQYGAEARQHSVYLRLPRGDVEMIPTRELWDAPALAA